MRDLRFECPGTQCQEYCAALRSQGVLVNNADVTNCNVPGMFSVEKGSVEFNPELSDGPIRNEALTEKLGGAICGMLLEHMKRTPEQAAVSELIDVNKKVLDSRFTLWQEMLVAARDGRIFTDIELNEYLNGLGQAQKEAQEKNATVTPELGTTAQAAIDSATLHEYGLVFDDQIIGTVNRLVGNLIDGNPTLIVGDQGIAKTQAAKFVSRLLDADKVPVVISCHRDMMTNELIGGTEIIDGDTHYGYSKFIQAIIDGRPVTFDEINVCDQGTMLRLQDYLLTKPGEPITVQEKTDGEPIRIGHGYGVFATANEASVRHQHRNKFGAAFRDRFTIEKLGYPDMDDAEPLKKLPPALLRLALAAASNEKGTMSKHIKPEELEVLVRLSHVTQYLYSKPARNARLAGVSDQNATTNFLDDEPIMTDCITPRAMVSTIKKCAAGNKPGVNLTSEIDRLITALDQAGSTHNQGYARKALALLRKKTTE